MERYVTKRASEQTAPSAMGFGTSNIEAKRRRRGAAIGEFEVHGKLSRKHRQQLSSRFLHSLCQVALSWQYPLNSQGIFADNTSQDSYDHVLSCPHRIPIVSVDFEPSGEHVASVSSSGSFALHHFHDMCTAATTGKGEEVEPCQLSAGSPCSTCVWNPLDESKVALGTSDRVRHHVELIAVDGADIHCVMRLQRGKVNSAAGRRAATESGPVDVGFVPGDCSRIGACGRDGEVHIWDVRAGPYPKSTCEAPQAAGRLHCLQFAPDGQVVYAGSETGSILAWDLRSVAPPTSTFRKCNKASHPQLTAFNLAKEFRSIPTLQEQAGVTPSGVHSLALDPSDSRHLAFHLQNGWSGVLDTATLHVTHAHCPPVPWDHEHFQATVRTHPHRKRPAWLPSHSVYCAPSSITSEVYLLNFSPSRASRYWLASPATTEEELPRPLSVETTRDVHAIAAHPSGDHLVAGGEAGTLLLLSTSNKAAAEDRD